MGARAGCGVGMPLDFGRGDGVASPLASVLGGEGASPLPVKTERGILEESPGRQLPLTPSGRPTIPPPSFQRNERGRSAANAASGRRRQDHARTALAELRGGADRGLHDDGLRPFLRALVWCAAAQYLLPAVCAGLLSAAGLLPRASELSAGGAGASDFVGPTARQLLPVSAQVMTFRPWCCSYQRRSSRSQVVSARRASTRATAAASTAPGSHIRPDSERPAS